MQIPFVGQAYKMPSLDIDAQNCINWFIVMDQTGKYPVCLLPSPGHTLFSVGNASETSIRAAIVYKKKAYIVSGNKFYRLFPNGNRTELGTLCTSQGIVKIISNDTQLSLTDGFNGYVYQVIKTSEYDEGVFERITKTSSVIGDPTFTGTGLDDLATSGDYTGTTTTTYRVEIQTAGTPDKFRWSDSDGETWNVQNIDVTTDVIDLNNGVQIQFSNTTGHTANDYWQFDVSTDDSFYPPKYPTNLDGYGVYGRQGTVRMYITEINDFKKINALDYVSVNNIGDNIVATISIKEELWVFCENHIYLWYNTGAATFPFEPRSNFVKNFGCEAPYSLSLGGENVLFWLGTNENNQRCILMMNDYQPLIISTEPIDSEIAKYEVVDDAIGMTYYYEGQLFYSLTFPTQNTNWTYSVNTKSWHQRLMWTPKVHPNVREYELERWSANCIFAFNGKTLIGDFVSSNIYELDSTSYLESNGEHIICERTTQHVLNDLNRVFLEWLIIDFEAGRGLVTGQGSDPTVMLSISKDGGHSWPGEIWKKLGKLGETRARAKFNRLGYARNWTFRVRSSDPTYRVLLGAVGEMEVSQE